MVTAYPLQWPAGWPRTELHQRQRAKFGTRGSSGYLREKSMAEAVWALEYEISAKGFRGQDLVISTNVELRRDGLPYSGRRAPEDTGCGIYFELNGKPIAMPCDKWDRVEDNVYAVAKHIEAMRGQHRWGVGNLERAFTGYLALPAPDQKRSWHLVLDVAPDASMLDVKLAYKELTKIHHPDKGGDPDKWYELQDAYKDATNG